MIMAWNYKLMGRVWFNLLVLAFGENEISIDR